MTRPQTKQRQAASPGVFGAWLTLAALIGSLGV